VDKGASTRSGVGKESHAVDILRWVDEKSRMRTDASGKKPSEQASRSKNGQTSESKHYRYFNPQEIYISLVVLFGHSKKFSALKLILDSSSVKGSFPLASLRWRLSFLLGGPNRSSITTCSWGPRSWHLFHRVLHAWSAPWSCFLGFDWLSWSQDRLCRCDPFGKWGMRGVGHFRACLD